MLARTPAKTTAAEVMRAINAILIGCLLTSAGCASRLLPGNDRIVTLSQRPARAQLNIDAKTAVYAHADGGDTLFIVSDRSPEELLDGRIDQGQILVLELLWRPRAGATPVDATATNMSVRHLIVSGDAIGLYGGSGFARLTGDPGDDRVRVKLLRSTIQLLETNPALVDQLSPAETTGRVTFDLDPTLTRRIWAILRSYMGELQPADPT